MIIFPIKKKPIPFINNIRYCVQCGVLFNEYEFTKDYGICSLECGYKLRGLSESDVTYTAIDIFR